MARRIIIIEDDNFPYDSTQSFTSHSDPCENCPNNPKNNPHASGICNCVLPYMNNTIY